MRGRSAHSGRDFSAGRNALALASHLATQLDRLNGQRTDTTINIGHMVGGGAVNVVPDLAVLRINVRVPDMDSMHWFEANLSDILAQVDQENGYSVSVFGGFSSPPKLVDHAQRELMNAIESATKRLGHNVQWMTSGGASDGNKLTAAGLPNIDTLGPIGDRIHSPDEWVDPTTIPFKAQVVVELLSHWNVNEQSPDLSLRNRQVL